jgi:hypothetical protein
MANTKFQTQEGGNQNTRFLNGKNHTPLETKANKKISVKLNQSRQLPLKREHKILSNDLRQTSRQA